MNFIFSCCFHCVILFSSLEDKIRIYPYIFPYSLFIFCMLDNRVASTQVTGLLFLQNREFRKNMTGTSRTICPAQEVCMSRVSPVNYNRDDQYHENLSQAAKRDFDQLQNAFTPKLKAVHIPMAICIGRGTRILRWLPLTPIWTRLVAISVDIFAIVTRLLEGVHSRPITLRQRFGLCFDLACHKLLDS